jgi:hypothetical protein
MCNETNESVLPLEEIYFNNSDLLPTLVSEEIPFNESTFKLKRDKIEKYHIAFQVLLLKMDNNVPVTINHKAIYFDLSYLKSNITIDKIMNRITHSEATLLKNEIDHCRVLLFHIKLKSDLMHSTFLKFNY